VSPLYLSDRHRELLRSSGLTDQTIADNKLCTISDPKLIAKILNKKVAYAKLLGECLAFSCLHPKTGELIGIRLRPDNPQVEPGPPEPGKEPRLKKYESPYRGPLLIFIPARTRSLHRLTVEHDCIWTEGERKAMLLDQLDRYAVIGLTGVWGAHDVAARWPEGKGKGKPKGPWRLAPVLSDNATIANRRHTILFDSDAAENADIMRAAHVLAGMLRDAGATDVRFATPPANLEGFTP
jgi:hypothetical protein